MRHNPQGGWVGRLSYYDSIGPPHHLLNNFLVVTKPDPLSSKAGQTLLCKAGQSLLRKARQNLFERGRANSFARLRLTLRLSNMSSLFNLDKALQVSITAPNISGVATLVVSCFVSFIIGVNFRCWRKRDNLLEKPHFCAPGWLSIPWVGKP